MTDQEIGKLVWVLIFIGIIGFLTFKGIPVIFIPILWGFITLLVAWLLHRRDKKKASKRPPLPCEGHKGTWSNPDYFTEDELNNKD